MEEQKKKYFLNYFSIHSKILDDNLSEEDKNTNSKELKKIRDTLDLDHDQIMEKAKELINEKM